MEHKKSRLQTSRYSPRSSRRRKWISKLVHLVKNHSDRDASIADLQQKHPCSPSGEESTQPTHEMGDVEYFEMCETSTKLQCIHCLKCWPIGIVYCTCGTCMIPTERPRKSTKDRFDALSIANNVIRKGPARGARHVLYRSTARILSSSPVSETGENEGFRHNSSTIPTVQHLQRIAVGLRMG